LLIQNGIAAGAQITSIANGANAANSTVNILSGAATAGTQTFNLFGGVSSGATQVTNINTGASAMTLNLGNATGASGTVMLVGTGNFSLDGAATSTYTFAPSTTSGTINFGGTGANTGTATILGGTGAQTINFANSTGVKTLSIATGAAANVVALGSTNTTSSTTINGGSGGVNIVGANLQIATAGKFLEIKGASFAATNSIGLGTLASGTVTILNTNIAAGDVILLTRTASNSSTTLGELTYTISASTSFTVTSLILGTPGSTQTGDTSTFSYIIVRPT
jgi:hypothetical protein